MNKRVILAVVLLVIIGISLGVLGTVFFQSYSQKTSLERLTHYEHTVYAHFVAVDEQGNGALGDLITEVRDGQGLVLVNVNNVLADVTTQYSARLAALVASNATKIDVSNLDIIYNLKSDAGVVAGQSAGSIMAVSTIAALENKQLRNDVIITGSINADGELVSAGGLRGKAEAAKKGDARLFLVPKGNGGTAVNLTRVEECGDYFGTSYCKVRYPGEVVSVGDEFGLQVIEIDTVAEAMRYFL